MNHIPKRRSIRLINYDYSQSGYYYITLCTQNRELYFENNIIKKIIEKHWLNIPKRFNDVKLDEWVAMDNHLHGIIVINNGNNVDNNRRGRPMCLPANEHMILTGEHTNEYTIPAGGHTGPPLQNKELNPTLGQIIQWFKTMTTNYYIQGVKNNNWPKFDKRLWQRNYYEHVIRDKKSLDKIREYIKFNPLNWDKDKNNPKNFKKIING